MLRLLDEIETTRPERYVLERFHLSHFALDYQWDVYQEIDARCAALECKIVLLKIPNGGMAPRSLYRSEYDGRDWQGFIQHYGSEGKALEAIRRSQQLRFDALELTAMRHLIIDTAGRAWDDYAAQIGTFAGWG